MSVFKASSHNMAKYSIQVAQKVFQHSWLVRKQGVTAKGRSQPFHDCKASRTTKSAVQLSCSILPGVASHMLKIDWRQALCCRLIAPSHFTVSIDLQDQGSQQPTAMP